MSARLRVIDGPDKGQLYELPPGDPILIGRGKQTATALNDPHASRIHCQIKVDGAQMILTDLDSVGGTFVNGQQVSRHVLKSGDVIHVGSTKMRVEVLNLAEDATLPPGALPSAALSKALADAASRKPTAVTTGSAPLPNLPPERMRELSGRMLGQFQIGEVLGTGKSGLVFRADDTKNGREVALKVLWPDFNKDEEGVQRFVRAMRTMLPLKHPHLVTIYQAGRVTPYCYVAMELIEGDSAHQIAQRFGREGVVDWRYALRVAAHISRALAFAHGYKIVHRNITPQNILVRTKEQVAKLSDLMTVKAMEGPMAKELTQPGELLGDLRFMAPERTRGGELDERSDIYGLGAAVYNILTGRPPFLGDSFTELILAIRRGDILPPQRFQPGIPDDVQAAVVKMLAIEPEHRFASARELLGTLEGLARKHKVPT